MRYFLYCLLILFLWPGSALSAEILMVTWQGHFVSEKAFEKRIRELRPNIKIKYMDAKRSKKELSNLLRNYDLSSTDLIYSFGTTGTHLVKKIVGDRMPIVFNMVSAPVLSGIVESFEKPGTNITGAKLLVDFGTQLRVYLKLRRIKTLALWFDPREKQNAIVYKAIYLYGKAYGVEVIPFRVIPDAPNSEEKIKKVAEETNKLDAMYFVSNSSFAVHSDRLWKYVDPNLLVLGSMNTDVMAGATIALGPDLSERGQAVAEIANRILNGESISKIPVDVVDEKNAIMFFNKKKGDVAMLNKLKTLGIKYRQLEQTGLPGQ